MKAIEIKKGTLISAGKSFVVSIGTYDSREVAIISRGSRKFVKQKRKSVSPRLKKVLKENKNFLNCETDCTFSFMTEERATKLIKTLRGIETE